MPQTIPPQQQYHHQRTPQEHPLPSGADYGEHFSGREAFEERYVPSSSYAAPPSGGFFGEAYERFLQMPVAVVLAVLWVAGMALLSLCVLVLYMLGTSLVSAVAGV